MAATKTKAQATPPPTKPKAQPASPKAGTPKVAAATMASRVASSKKPAAPKPPTAKQSATSAKQLNQYVHANGNMSVPRRMHVVVPALERLGYSTKDAKDIALNAPLNASAYDAEAVITSLRYAKSISTLGQMQAGGQPPATVAGAMTPNPVDMPPAAEAALNSADFREQPISTAKKVLGPKIGARVDKALRPVKDRLDKFADKPVPGGLGGLFTVNLLFLGFVIPANAQGFTRFQLLYLTVLNRTFLPEKKQSVDVPNSGIVQGIMDVSQSIGYAATAIGDVAGAIGGIAQIPQDIEHAIESPAQGVVSHLAGGAFAAAHGLINAPIIGGLLQGQGPFGLAYNVPQNNTGTNPPPPSTVVGTPL